MFFNLRNCTISSLVVRPRWKKAYIKPKITITGNWLKDAGFQTGEKLEIQVYKNKLVIVKNENKAI